MSVCLGAGARHSFHTNLSTFFVIQATDFARLCNIACSGTGCSLKVPNTGWLLIRFPPMTTVHIAPTSWINVLTRTTWSCIFFVGQLPLNCRGQAWASFDGKGRQQLWGGDALIVRMSEWPVPAVCEKESSGDFLRSVRESLHWNRRNIQLADERPSPSH